MPVATNGDSGVNNGTAWRCMFDPINARFASSCSRNGIMLAATETNCFGDVIFADSATEAAGAAGCPTQYFWEAFPASVSATP